MRRVHFGGGAEPWGFVAGHPIGTTVLLVSVLAISSVVTMFLIAFGQTELLKQLCLVPADVWSGRVWQLVTWPLINELGIWFVISLFLLFVFGREVESLLGRNGSLKFYLYLAAALTVVAMVLGHPMAGASDLNFGVFLAFAITSPGAVLWCRIGLTAKWAALILIAVGALQRIAAHAWSALAILGVVVAGSAVILRLMGAAHSLPWLKVPSLRSIPAVRIRRAPKLTVVPNAQVEVDRLLDKIATSGLDSLTAKEKSALEAASARQRNRK